MRLLKAKSEASRFFWGMKGNGDSSFLVRLRGEDLSPVCIRKDLRAKEKRSPSANRVCGGRAEGRSGELKGGAWSFKLAHEGKKSYLGGVISRVLPYHWGRGEEKGDQQIGIAGGGRGKAKLPFQTKQNRWGAKPGATVSEGAPGLVKKNLSAFDSKVLRSISCGVRGQMAGRGGRGLTFGAL